MSGQHDAEQANHPVWHLHEVPIFRTFIFAVLCIVALSRNALAAHSSDAFWIIRDVKQFSPPRLPRQGECIVMETVKAEYSQKSDTWYDAPHHKVNLWVKLKIVPCR